MKALDLASHYPVKTFSEKFQEKETALKGINTPEDQIAQKKGQFQKLFEFDNSIQDIRRALNAYGDREIEDNLSARILYFISQLATINSYLDRLSYAEPKNVNRIFEAFDRNTKYLFTEVQYNREISAGKVIVDDFISEIRNISRELTTTGLDQEKLIKAEKIAAKLTRNAELYDKAAKTAESWIKSEGRAIGSSLGDKADRFQTKADDDHHTKGVWGWFWGGLASGLMALGIILYFIQMSGSNVTVGSALLRISILIVISYFSFYCLQQFSNHRKMYDIYRFKAIALNTMEELVKSYPEPAEKERVLNTAMNVIFSEPTLKEDKVIQEKVLSRTLDIVQKKI